MGLEIYHQKRDFRRTPEPRGKISRADKRRFVCQEHHASSLHFDFRLEIGGVLKSWSLRKGPSMNPELRRMAAPTEDHPIEYLEFQGHIPEGNYGAGEHMIWDSGVYRLLEGDSPEEQFEKGKLKFELKGDKLKGTFNFFRLGGRDQWLLVKGKDEYAEENWKLELLAPDKEGNRFIEEKSAAPQRRNTHKPLENGDVVKISAKPEKGERLPTIKRALNEKEPQGDRRVKIGDYALELTSLERLYWPDENLTKADFIRYYHQIFAYILPYLENRPVIMKRYPNGIGGPSFHQHDVDEVPEFVRTVTLEAEDAKGAHPVDYVVCDNLATHLYLANFGAIERHPWHSRVESLNCPDWFVFDLDPGEEVEFETICEASVLTREIIAGIGLASYAKTSGSRGIHVYVPVKAEYDYEQIADLAERIANRVAHENPTIATIERSKQKRRKNQIYIDHLQNAYGKSVVAPYSVRPRRSATVSAPVDWDEIEQRKISIEDFTIENMLERLETKGDLFQKVLTDKQSLEEAFEKIKGRTKKAR